MAGPSLAKHYIDVVFKVKEKRRFHASIVAHAGNQVGDAVSCVSVCVWVGWMGGSVHVCFYCQRFLSMC